MTLAPLLAAPAMVQVHAAAALSALALGLVQLLAPKGTLPHRRLGWAWVVVMAVVAGSSFWITGPSRGGHYSWVHALSAYVLVMLPLAVMAARRGRSLKDGGLRHGRMMASIFVGGLVIAGGFTLMPGRIMGAVVFGW